MLSRKGSVGGRSEEIAKFLTEVKEDQWYSESGLPWGRTALWRMRKEGLPSLRAGRTFIYRGGSILDWLRSREGK